MANSFLKATQIAATALGLLEREIVLPGLVWRNGQGDFAGAAGDTISIRVPARTTARTRTLRGARPSASEGDGIITMDALTETKVDVTLDTDVYNAVPVTDEELTLDIRDFGEQVLKPQVRAVAEGVENAVATKMTDAAYATTLTLDTTDPYKTFVDARAALNKANVSMTERRAVVGSDIAAVLLKSDHLARVDQSGTDSALRDAVIGRLAGFGEIVESQAIPSDTGFVFHKTAYVLVTRAPAVPDGATYGRAAAFQDLALRWLKDYDFRNVQDRSLVDTFIGTGTVIDGVSNEVQTATVTGSPTGGTFTLTYSGQTTAAIAYNATAAQVKAALIALSNIGSGDVQVSGAAGGPYTVTFGGSLAGSNVAAMTASGASLTGGSSPSVAIATSTAGAASTFVRAVKLVMP